MSRRHSGEQQAPTVLSLALPLWQRSFRVVNGEQFGDDMCWSYIHRGNARWFRELSLSGDLPDFR